MFNKKRSNASGVDPVKWLHSSAFCLIPLQRGRPQATHQARALEDTERHSRTGRTEQWDCDIVSYLFAHTIPFFSSSPFSSIHSLTSASWCACALPLNQSLSYSCLPFLATSSIPTVELMPKMRTRSSSGSFARISVAQMGKLMQRWTVS